MCFTAVQELILLHPQKIFHLVLSPAETEFPPTPLPPDSLLSLSGWFSPRFTICHFTSTDTASGQLSGNAGLTQNGQGKCSHPKAHHWGWAQLLVQTDVRLRQRFSRTAWLKTEAAVSFPFSFLPFKPTRTTDGSIIKSVSQLASTWVPFVSR